MQAILRSYRVVTSLYATSQANNTFGCTSQTRLLQRTHSILPRDAVFGFSAMAETRFSDDDLKEFNLPNLHLAFHFAYERYEIYVKKEKERQPPPWTTDQILQKYRFCNLHREHDNVSRTIIGYLRRCKSRTALIFNAINFRRLNQNWTIGSLGLSDPKHYSPADFVNRLETGMRCQLQCEGKGTFNDGAYVIPPPSGARLLLLLNMLEESFTNGIFSAKNLIPGLKIRVSRKTFEQRSNHSVLQRLMELGYVEVSKKFHNFKVFLFALENLLIIPQLDTLSKARGTFGFYSKIRALNGIGPFLAGQICVDVGYIDKKLFDENQLAPAGPGCMRGLNLLYNIDVPKNPNEKTEQRLLQNLRTKQFLIWTRLGYKRPSFGEMSLMTIENLMCEASKYISLTHHSSRRRQKYRKRKSIEHVLTKLEGNSIAPKLEEDARRLKKQRKETEKG